MKPFGRLPRGIRDTLRGMLTHSDPTLTPPPGYTRQRADLVLGEAFRRCFEYLTGSRIDGDILEFGTLRGYTARILAEFMRETDSRGRLFLFDSFEGLPDIVSPVDQASYEVAVNRVWARGIMRPSQGMEARIGQALAKIIPPDRLRIVKGFFEHTLGSAPLDRKAALVHIDCDLYASAKLVLDTVIARGLLQDGCLLVCDDFNCNRANPGMGERRALQEAFDAQTRYSYSPWFSYGWHGQVAFVHDSSSTSMNGTGVK